jgi:hypothetical protein
MLFKLQQRVKMLYIIKNLIESYMMFNEDIRSKKSLQHKKYTINRCTFILMFFMIYLTIDLYYYYEYLNMYLVCTYNMARYYFHIVIFSVFLYKSDDVFVAKLSQILFTYQMMSLLLS